LFRFLYDNLLIPAMDIGLRVAVPFNSKAARAAASRKNWEPKLEFALRGRKPARRIMMHAPSVGEFLQGRAVLDILLDDHPEMDAVVSYFSPSAQNIAANYERAVAHTILPLDTPDNARRLLDLVKPTLLMFSRADVWPNLVEEAGRRGVKLALVAGTMSASARRLHPAAAALARDGLKALDLVSAISEDDARRFKGFGLDSGKVVVGGDPRFDQAWRKARSVEDDDPLLKLLRSDAPTLVAGSTWPADEREIAAAFKTLKRAHPELRLIIAPHEPSSARIGDLHENLTVSGAAPRAATLSEVESGEVSDWDAVIIDRVGILAKLYRLGDVAFVGGSFAGRVHNVMEPACMGIPVLFGPKYSNSREAELLAGAGGAFSVKNASELEGKLAELLGDEEARESAGAAAREFMESNLGAAEKTARLLMERFPEIFASEKNG